MTEPKKPSYTLEFTPAAIRELEKLDPNVRRKVFSDIEKLKGNPRPHGVEKMETKEKLYRVYVGPGKNYRAIYQIRDEALLVLVVKVGDRKEVYRRVK
jgi:mRNA interferase RelE/StbE